jgi:hypothetical protein
MNPAGTMASRRHAGRNARQDSGSSSTLRTVQRVCEQACVHDEEMRRQLQTAGCEPQRVAELMTQFIVAQMVCPAPAHRLPTGARKGICPGSGGATVDAAQVRSIHSLSQELAHAGTPVCPYCTKPAAGPTGRRPGRRRVRIGDPMPTHRLPKPMEKRP